MNIPASLTSPFAKNLAAFVAGTATGVGGTFGVRKLVAWRRKKKAQKAEAEVPATDGATDEPVNTDRPRHADGKFKSKDEPKAA